MESLRTLLEETAGNPVRILGEDPVGGGCIHDARRIRTTDGDLFVKRSPAEDAPLLRSEAEGLAALRATRTVRVPETHACGVRGDTAFLALEWIDLRRLDRESGARLGEELARLHLAATDLPFGWEQDNFIGRTPQENTPHDDWPAFFRERRLLPQLRMAKDHGHDLPPAEPFLGKIEAFFPGESRVPCSPLHGDLWGGNAASDPEGRPVLFDPAFYRGDPETDLAFSRFFGGFPESFYRAYSKHHPERPGWQTRQTLYNLYHVLNHLNLFGAGYLAEARRMIAGLNDRAGRG